MKRRGRRFYPGRSWRKQSPDWFRLLLVGTLQEKVLSARFVEPKDRGIAEHSGQKTPPYPASIVILIWFHV